MQRLFVFCALLVISIFPVTAKETVYIYAASSMTEVVKSIQSHFRDSNIQVKGVFGSSSSLARQISQGAPADIYISANTRWMSYLKKELGLNTTPSHIIAYNQLVVISQYSDALIADLFDSQQWLAVLGNNRLAMGDSNNVPVGIYAKQALQNLGVWSSISAQIAPMKNTRAVLAMVERGQSPLGIVYLTDAMQSERVQVLARIPAKLHSQIEYPVVQLTDKQESTLVFNYLIGEPMQNELIGFGFTTAKEQ